MSDDYLWDRTGLPEPDELELETLLRPLGLRRSADTAWAPAPMARGLTGRVVFGVLAAAACVAMGFWLGGRQLEEQAIVADGRAPVRSEALPPAPEHERALPVAPGGTGRARSEVLDPWGNERGPSPSHRAPGGRDLRSPDGEPSRQGVLDPWGAEPPAAPAARPPRAPRGGMPQDEIMDPWKPRSQPGEAQPGAGLPPAAIQRVVRHHRGSLASSCWTPAVERSAQDAPRTARVAVRLVIGPDGRVLSASHDGQTAGYPGLAPCVVGEMRRWRFPRSEGKTTVSVPLVFARP